MAVDYLSAINRQGSGLNISEIVDSLVEAETAPQVNKIISSKNYSKSHLTSIRNQFICDINSKLFQLTGNKTSIIETKHPEDNRVKAYKTDINSFKPKISFIKFVFEL